MKYIIHIPNRGLILDASGELMPKADIRRAKPFDTEVQAYQEMHARNMQHTAEVAVVADHTQQREK